jgi:hypothetical protein
VQGIAVGENGAALAGQIADGVVDIAVRARAVLQALARAKGAAGGLQPVQSVVGEGAAGGEQSVGVV